MPRDGRDEVLGSIKHALYATRKLTLPTSTPSPDRTDTDLDSTLVTALARSNAQADVVPGISAARLRLMTLARELNASSVSVSRRAANLLSEAEGVWPDTGDIHVRVRPDDSPDAIGDAELGVTVADYALADTGTIVALASPDEGRLDSVLPPAHIVIVPTSVILPDMWALFAEVKRRHLLENHSSMVFITGPSRTADIELTLTIGVHGPRCLRVLVIPGEVSTTR
jgi:L-lactate utilization protein LutC